VAHVHHGGVPATPLGLDVCQHREPQHAFERAGQRLVQALAVGWWVHASSLPVAAPARGAPPQAHGGEP